MQYRICSTGLVGLDDKTVISSENIVRHVMNDGHLIITCSNGAYLYNGKMFVFIGQASVGNDVFTPVAVHDGLILGINMSALTKPAYLFDLKLRPMKELSMPLTVTTRSFFTDAFYIFDQFIVFCYLATKLGLSSAISMASSDPSSAAAKQIGSTIKILPKLIKTFVPKCGDDHPTYFHFNTLKHQTICAGLTYCDSCHETVVFDMMTQQLIKKISGQVNFSDLICILDDHVVEYRANAGMKHTRIHAIY